MFRRVRKDAKSPVCAALAGQARIGTIVVRGIKWNFLTVLVSQPLGDVAIRLRGKAKGLPMGGPGSLSDRPLRDYSVPSCATPTGVSLPPVPTFRGRAGSPQRIPNQIVGTNARFRSRSMSTSWRYDIFPTRKQIAAQE